MKVEKPGRSGCRGQLPSQVRGRPGGSELLGCFKLYGSAFKFRRGVDSDSPSSPLNPNIVFFNHHSLFVTIRKGLRPAELEGLRPCLSGEGVTPKSGL